jgi:Domain of unknown function (DUF397)
MSSNINFDTTPQLTHAAWRKSSRTGGGSGGGGNCVEVAIRSKIVNVRDSKEPYMDTLAFSSDQWQNLIRGVKHGEFNL